MALIQTPYGPKTPELLTRAMDALEREPALLAIVRAMSRQECRCTYVGGEIYSCSKCDAQNLLERLEGICP